MANEAVEFKPEPSPQMNFHIKENTTKLVGLSTYFSEPSPSMEMI
jgi:hypothetical protein